jgi:signal recognition particle receptor subunit beta
MALINHRAREIHFKIVYYGAGLCGKTTNLRSLHDRLPPERRGRLLSIATDHERTLFFDFLPIDLGQVNGFTTRFHLYTVPGQVYYKLSRRAVLQGVDGLVFVADSHPAREQANRDSLADLARHLATLDLDLPAARLPRVIQYNKRDLPVALPVARLSAALNPDRAPEFEAIASDGSGVNETLRTVCKAVLARLSAPQGLGTPTPSVRPATVAVSPVRPPARGPGIGPPHAPNATPIARPAVAPVVPSPVPPRAMPAPAPMTPPANPFARPSAMPAATPPPTSAAFRGGARVQRAPAPLGPLRFGPAVRRLGPLAPLPPTPPRPTKI